MDESFSVDSRALRKSFDRASASFDNAAVLHREVRQRALERLLLLRQTPFSIVDLGAGTGHASHWLVDQFPNARVLAIDSSMGMLRESRQRIGGWRRIFGKRFTSICADASALPLRDHSIDWVFSNLMLPWCIPVEPVLIEVRRVLKPGGVFSFTSFGPDTLLELRRAWQQVDKHDHVLPFFDMHDLGDALVHAGFAEPVLDVERFTLTYRDVKALRKDLKAIGSYNALNNRARGLTGRSTLTKLTTAYELHRHEATLPATFEVVYGQAWQPAERPKKDLSNEVLVPLANLRRRR